MKKFILIIFCFHLNLLWAQEMLSFMPNSPFYTSLGFDIIETELIRQKNMQADQQFKIGDKKRIGIQLRGQTLENDLKEIPNFKALSFGLSTQSNLAEGKTIGASISYGSASDQLFKKSRDSTLQVNTIYHHSPKWIWLVNYSNNRPFLNNVPLPGFIYIQEHSRERTIMLGFPVIFINQAFFQSQASLNYFGLMPFQHQLRFYYNKLWLRPFIQFEQTVSMFFNSAREARQMRTFWFERRGSFGLEKALGPVLRLSLVGGYAFDRKFFEAKTFGNNRSSKTLVKDGSFLGFNLRSMF